MKRLHVKPAPGLKIRLYHAPERGYLPEGGARVPDNAEWRRALRDGDVVRVEADVEPSKPSKPKRRKRKPPEA